MSGIRKKIGDRMISTIAPDRGIVRATSFGLLLISSMLPLSLILLTSDGSLVLSRTILSGLAGLIFVSGLGVLMLWDYGRSLGMALMLPSFIIYMIQALGNPVTFVHLIVVLFTFWYLGRYEVKQHFTSPYIRIKSTPAIIKISSFLRSLSTHIILFCAVLIATFPVIWIIGTSLKPGNNLFDPELQIFSSKLTLDHYRNVIFEENFHKYLINSLICAAGTTFLTIFLSTTGAYALSKFSFKAKKSVLLSFIVVQMFPGVIIIIPYFILLNNLGLLDSYLGLIAAYSVTALPLCVWTMKGFFDTIPDDLIEAARVDGYSHSQIFRKIMLPLAKPAIAVTALFAFLSAWNEYVLAYTFMQNEEYYTLPVKIFMYIGGSSQQWGTFSAMSVLVSLPVVLMFILFQRFLTSGMTKGAVKG